MPKPLFENELRERLLRAGVAPRHVRRYLAELADHFADLKAEEERAGRNPANAESAALIRLGSMDELAQAMTEQHQFRSWCIRAPWAMFGCAPFCVLAAAYFVACFILWSGWKIFLPGTDSPFIPIHGLAIFYFGAGRLLYFSAPIFVGWIIALVAARQRLNPIWPSAGLTLIAVMGATAQVHTSGPTVSGGPGHVIMDFTLGSSLQGNLLHALTILSLTMLPYLIWRFRKGHSISA